MHFCEYISSLLSAQDVLDAEHGTCDALMCYDLDLPPPEQDVVLGWAVAIAAMAMAVAMAVAVAVEEEASAK